MLLVDCKGELRGPVFSCKDRVSVESATEIPADNNTLVLETDGNISIEEVDFKRVKRIIIGGESDDVPKLPNVQRAKITQCGAISCLTVEAALAIALHEWRRP
jgi:tRNA G18 (ribose-2'-O)-methylase SpoU